MDKFEVFFKRKFLAKKKIIFRIKKIKCFFLNILFYLCIIKFKYPIIMKQLPIAKAGFKKLIGIEFDEEQKNISQFENETLNS